jgi:hypothetical protein
VQNGAVLITGDSHIEGGDNLFVDDFGAAPVGRGAIQTRAGVAQRVKGRLPVGITQYAAEIYLVEVTSGEKRDKRAKQLKTYPVPKTMGGKVIDPVSPTNVAACGIQLLDEWSQEFLRRAGL